MSYRNIAELQEDNDLRRRIVAAAATEDIRYPWGWVDERMWEFAAQPGWGDAYASAQAGGVIRPGWDDAVITDGMILAAVQSMVPPTP